MTKETGLQSRTVAALHLAADAAEQKHRVADAVRVAWSALHRDRDAMGPAFRAWSVHERGDTRDISALGDVVRRRYRDAGPAAVAASLRAAATAVECTASDEGAILSVKVR